MGCRVSPCEKSAVEILSLLPNSNGLVWGLGVGVPKSTSLLRPETSQNTGLLVDQKPNTYSSKCKRLIQLRGTWAYCKGSQQSYTQLPKYLETVSTAIALLHGLPRTGESKDHCVGSVQHVVKFRSFSQVSRHQTCLVGGAEPQHIGIAKP